MDLQTQLEQERAAFAGTLNKYADFVTRMCLLLDEALAIPPAKEFEPEDSADGR